MLTSISIHFYANINNWMHSISCWGIYIMSYREIYTLYLLPIWSLIFFPSCYGNVARWRCCISATAQCCDVGGHDPAWQRWLFVCVLSLFLCSVMIPNMSSPACILFHFSYVIHTTFFVHMCSCIRQMLQCSGI